MKVESDSHISGSGDGPKNVRKIGDLVVHTGLVNNMRPPEKPVPGLGAGGGDQTLGSTSQTEGTSIPHGVQELVTEEGLMAKVREIRIRENSLDESKDALLDKVVEFDGITLDERYIVLHSIGEYSSLPKQEKQQNPWDVASWHEAAQSWLREIREVRRNIATWEISQGTYHTEGAEWGEVQSTLPLEARQRGYSLQESKLEELEKGLSEVESKYSAFRQRFVQESQQFRSEQRKYDLPLTHQAEAAEEPRKQTRLDIVEQAKTIKIHEYDLFDRKDILVDEISVLLHEIKHERINILAVARYYLSLSRQAREQDPWNIMSWNEKSKLWYDTVKQMSDKDGDIDDWETKKTAYQDKEVGWEEIESILPLEARQKEYSLRESELEELEKGFAEIDGKYNALEQSFARERQLFHSERLEHNLPSLRRILDWNANMENTENTGNR